ncbi:MAG TPA: LD-carboxypeptidase [bacterium]|nr:LD-carboxypeptidase [bacterium]
MTAAIRRFRPVEPGGKVRVVATSSPFDAALFNAGITFLERRGMRPVYDDAVFARTGYLAGDPDRRVAQMRDAFRDPETEAVWTARGGYGALQMLPLLTPHIAELRKHPKPFIGFSDATAIHSFLMDRCGFVTVHGPNITTLGQIERSSQRQAIRLLAGESDAFHIVARQMLTVRQGKAEGVVKGGNLSTLVSLVGTPWEPELKGSILFLEDVAEVPYRVDRLITQLRLAGKFAGVRGLVLGDFTYNDRRTERSVDPEMIVRSSGLPATVPVVANFPAGHGERNMAFLLGAVATLDTEAKTLSYQVR